jgi:hypothetical protein
MSLNIQKQLCPRDIPLILVVVADALVNETENIKEISLNNIVC